MKEGINSITQSTKDIDIIIESLVHIHAACILNDNTMATFLPPLSCNEMISDWKNNFLAPTADNTRIVLVHVSKVDSRTVQESEIKSPFEDRSWPVLPPKNNDDDGSETDPHQLEISGTVTLYCPPSQTGPFRALVLRLLVSPFHRRKNIARVMMAELEKQALSIGRWSLMLDTTVGTPAEFVYPRLGYQRLGVIPEYGISPQDGKLLDEVFYWKDLRTKEG